MVHPGGKSWMALGQGKSIQSSVHSRDSGGEEKPGNTLVQLS